MIAALIPLLLYGLAVGISLGLTGGGGSIITVPILVYLVGEPVHAAIATSLAIVGGIALQGFIGQRAQAHVPVGVALGLVGLLGTIPGGLLAQHVPGRILLLLFSLMMIAAAAAMFCSPMRGDVEGVRRHWGLIATIGVALGFLTGFLGVGGGFLIVPTLVLGLALPMRAAIPTSLLIIAINCATSLLTKVSMFEIDWQVTIAFLAGGLAGNAIGAFGAHRIDQRRLKQIFAVFVLGAGIFVASSATGMIPIRVK